MMKNFLSKISPFKSKVVKSPLDVSDFMKFDAPSQAAFQQFISSRFPDSPSEAAGEGKNTGIYGNPLEAADILVAKKRMHFDLKYRCGTEGRCASANGEIECRFPLCFQCRPVAKGGELFEERMNFELGQEDHPVYAPTVKACDDDNLELAVEQLSKVVADLEREARPFIVSFVEAQAKSGNQAAELVSREKFEEIMRTGPPNPNDPKVYLAPDGKPFGVPRIDELIAMSLWKATLMVNVDKEEEAVDSLLRLAKLLPKEYKSSAFAGAATWAAYNDMEIRFFASYVKHFPDFEPTKKTVLTKPFLLNKVVEACGPGLNGDFYLDHVVNTVFAKEISCILNRAQASQLNGDITEDPIASPVVKDSIQYLRHNVGGTFWNKFFDLCVMPPIIPKGGMEQSASAEAAMTGYTGVDTPRHVLDGVARSMLLHHVAKNYEADNKGDSSVPPSKAQDACMKRMQELVSIVKLQAQIDQQMVKDTMYEEEGGGPPMGGQPPMGQSGGSGPGINYPGSGGKS